MSTVRFCQRNGSNCIFLDNILLPLGRFLEWSRAIYIILVTGLALRIAALSMVAHVPLRNEAPGYMQMALQLLHHENFAPYWPPGVPYYLLFAQRLFGESILVARASILLVYLAFTVFLFFFIRRIAGLRAANLAAVIFVFYPPYVRDSFNPSTEYPAAATLMAIVFLVTLAGRKSGFTTLMLTGLALGALILIRPSSLLVALFVLLYLLKRSRKLWVPLVPLVIAALLVSAWLWKAYSMTGRFVRINDSNSQNFFWGNNPYTPIYTTWGEGQDALGMSSAYRAELAAITSQPPEVQNQLYTKLAVHYILSRPDLFLLRSFNRSRAYFGFPVHYAEPLKTVMGVKGRKWISLLLTAADVAFYWPLMMLAIVFLFIDDHSLLPSDHRLALLGAVAAYALPYWFSEAQPRFNFPVVPLIAVLAVLLIELLLRKPASEVLRPVIVSVRRRRALLVALVAFVYIQIEWIYMAYFHLRY